MPTNDHCFTGCSDCCGRGCIYVKQRPYLPGQGARMDPFQPREILFRKGGSCGLPITDGVSKRFQDLEGRDSRPFQDDPTVADQATLRVEWPGYPPWYTYFRTRDSTADKCSVQLSSLAEHICKGINKFIIDMEGAQCSEQEWRVGKGTGLDVDNLALVSLTRASYGSWVASISYTLIQSPNPGGIR